MYVEETEKVLVVAEPVYIAEQSKPEQNLYIFAYTITIENRGSVPVQLLSRHWIITDGVGTVREVRGEGVIGEQPILEAGGAHQYSSFTPLPTPTGNMRGSYEMKRLSDGTTFQVRIPAFFLRTDAPTIH